LQVVNGFAKYYTNLAFCEGRLAPANEMTDSANPGTGFLLPVSSGALCVNRFPAYPSPIALSIVLPTFNEVQNIEPMVRRLDAVLKSMAVTYEIVVVDDDSPDLTWQRALGLAQSVRQLRVMRRTHERGLATAVVRGWQASRGDVLAVMDADLQHPPEIVPRLWSAIESGADLAIASRWAAAGGVGNWSWHRFLVSRTAYMIGRIMLPNVFAMSSDPLSGFFLVRRKKLCDVSMHPRGYKILIEVLARTGLAHVAEVGYIFQERTDAKSKATWHVYRDYLLHLARLRQAVSRGSSPQDQAS
jgi:dolichol-phosphate mannosyltransferase